MSVEHIIAFNLVLWAAILSPGPALLIALQTSLSSGRQAGMMVGLGLASMAALWTLLALLGLQVIFQIVPWAYAIVKTLGALYLIYIAWGMWRRARDPISAKPAAAARAFWQGFAVNSLNPKSALFAASVLVVIFPSTLTHADKVLIVVNHLVVEVVFYTSMAFLMTRAGVRDTYLWAKLYLDRIAAVVLAGLGIRLLTSR